jgi:FdhE protein
MEYDNLSEQIRKGLLEWAGEAHSNRFFTFYLGLLQIQADAEATHGEPEYSPHSDELKRRLVSGKPALDLASISLNRQELTRTFRSVARLFARYPEVMGEIPAFLTVDSFEVPSGWLDSWFLKKRLSIDEEFQSADSGLIETLLEQALRPFLIGYSRVLTGKYRQEYWRRPYCPVCGSKPDFAYLERENGARWLVCGTCSTEWQYQRMQCPFCFITDAKQLSFLSDDEGLYRLYLCQHCKSYLKAIDLRKTTKKIIPGLESLTTLALDRQALDSGYHRGDSNPGAAKKI